MDEFTKDFGHKPKKRVCLNCDAVVSEGDEKCWFCGITLQ